MKQIVNESAIAGLVEANVRFTRADIEGQHTLLGVLYVQRKAKQLSNEDVRERLLRSIHQQLRQKGFSVTPLIEITVLTAPNDWQAPP